MARRALKITLFYFEFQIFIFNQSPLNCRYLHSSWVVSAKLERDQFWVLFFGCDLHHRVQSLSGLDVGESFPRGDLPQAVHVSCCDQQVAGKDNRLTKSVSWFRDCWIMTTPLVDSCWKDVEISHVVMQLISQSNPPRPWQPGQMCVRMSGDE